MKIIEMKTSFEIRKNAICWIDAKAFTIKIDCCANDCATALELQVIDEYELSVRYR